MQFPPPIVFPRLKANLGKVLKAILVRRDYIVHLKGIFPKMEAYISNYGKLEWFSTTFGVDINGCKAQALQVDSGDEAEASAVTVADQTVASSYSCLKPLTLLCAAWFKQLDAFSFALNHCLVASLPF